MRSSRAWHWCGYFIMVVSIQCGVPRMEGHTNMTFVPTAGSDLLVLRPTVSHQWYRRPPCPFPLP